MSGLLNSEMSAFKAGCGNMFTPTKEAGYANILPKTRTGAGYEDAGSDLAGNERANSLDSGSRDIRHIRQANAQVEEAL